MSVRIGDAAVSADATHPVGSESVEAVAADSYGQIFNSTALIGGSSLLIIAIGIIRTKSMALLLGPAGFGLVSLYMSVVGLAAQLAGLGINSSGVRQIAEAAGSGDHERLARTALILRRLSLLLGTFGALLLILLSSSVADATFGDRARAQSLWILSLVVFFNVIGAGQGALLQGLRRIADLATMNVVSALLGTIAALAIVFALREHGIVIALVALAAVSTAVTSQFAAHVTVNNPQLSRSEFRRESMALLRLGFAFMSSGVMTLGVAYVVRIMVLHVAGLTGAGLYQAAWTLGGLYVGIILQSMGADFYPRLTVHANDNVACNRLVNEQTLIGLLLACPGVIATLSFAPLVIGLFYSSRFVAATEILRWICLGVTLQVLTWPMGFIMIAKGKQRLFLLSEATWTTAALALAWACVTAFGIAGAGIAYFASYIVHGLITYPIARKLTGFVWSPVNTRTCVLFIAVIAIVFCAGYRLTPSAEIGLGLLMTGLTSVYSVRTLIRLVPPERLPRALRRASNALRALRTAR